jgi:hypothetical protein
MTVEPKVALRLQFLVRVVRKECQHLVDTDKRLFESVFTLEQANQLEKNIALAERVEAFVGRVWQVAGHSGGQAVAIAFGGIE